MSKILESLLTGAQNFLKFLFAHFYLIFKDLWAAKSTIQLRYLVNDFLSVLRSVGMFTFFNLVALIVFTVLPQGKDILLIIAEDITQFKPGNLLWLLIGVVFWSIVSEYGTRYSIYVTDNSGHNLTDERVKWRKAVQKAVTEISLMLPYMIVLAGFAINYVQDTSLSGNEKKLGFGIPMLCTYLVFTGVAKFYFSTEKRKKWRENPNAFQRFMLIPDKELEWCKKLYGIYNRYVYSLPKPSNFTDGVKNTYQVFANNFLNQTQDDKKNFPQDPDMMDKESIVPKEFVLEKFTKEGEDENSAYASGNYKWVYSIPRSFYQTLHRQLKVIIIFSFVLFALVCVLPIRAYSSVGAPGLVVLAFGCWSGIYIGLIYMDYAFLRSWKISLRFVLLLMLIGSSLFNNDHPVRYNISGNACCDTRPELKQHFNKWLNHYTSDSNTLYQLKKDSVNEFYPVVFVCAEGGALRTGAFVAQTLSFLQDSISKHYGVDVSKSVYAYSGVSGGSLGISFFNAAANLSAPGDLKQDTSYSALTKLFFNEDYLAPVIGKMFYADIINLFVPFHIQKFDRAIVLEQAWEQGFEKVIKKDSRNIFSADYRNLYADTSKIYPAMFINTTEVESGRQCWLSNVRPDTADVIFADKRDLLAYKIRGGVNYSTVVNFSTRFPLISPAGTLIQDEGKKFHYVDGGYVENTGAGTMLEVLHALEPFFKLSTPGDTCIRKNGPVVKPFVFVLQYNQYNDGPPPSIDFANEFSEIINGIYNTRSGRSSGALEELARYTKRLGGETMILPLQKTGSEVPLNWVLSKKSLDKIEDDIKSKWNRRNVGELRKFFAIDTTKYRPRRRSGMPVK